MSAAKCGRFSAIPTDPDVLFLGTSVVHAGVSVTQIRDALEQHLHRRAHVAMLAMYWQGLDLQYFLLRNYLEHHHPLLVIWNQSAFSRLKDHRASYRGFSLGSIWRVILGNRGLACP